MKLISILTACALSACGGQQTAPSTPTSNAEQPTAPTTDNGQPCTQEVALQCPEGQIDACLKTPPEGVKHACVAK